MTQQDVKIIKQAILDAIEGYQEGQSRKAPFVQTEIGVVQGTGTTKGNKVKVKGATYDNILSIGNIDFPTGCVVQVFIPNGQYSNSFILGQLDDTPCNIKGGEINIGDGKFVVDKHGNATMQSATITGGGLNIQTLNETDKTYVTKYIASDDSITYSSGLSPKGGVESDVKFSNGSKIIMDICGGEYMWYYLASSTASPKEFINFTVEGLDTYSPNANFWIGSDAGDEAWFNCPVTFKENVYNSNGGVAFTSDRNAKENISDLDEKKSTDFIYSLNPVSYKYKTGNRQHHGFIAQEVKQSMGKDDWGVYLDSDDKREYKALRYDEIIADLVKTVQSQNKRIEELEKEIKKKG